MKSSNLWRIIWIVGIYAILILILYLVVTYKVKWEYKDLNTYLYVYDCGHELCTSTTKQDDYYSKILCEDDICPYIVNIAKSNLTLKNSNNTWIYNYINGEIVSNKYNYYKYIGNDMYVVGDNTESYGIMDYNGEIIVDLKYNYIDDYKNGYISYIKDGFYGITNIDNTIDIKPAYEDVVLINDKIFAAKSDNIYRMYPYSDPDNSNNNEYDYVYSYNGITLVIKDKKIDILDENLTGTLLMKIDTFYEYKTEKERESLDIYSDDENIYFRVFINEKEYTEYKYNIKNNKMV